MSVCRGGPVYGGEDVHGGAAEPLPLPSPNSGVLDLSYGPRRPVDPTVVGCQSGHAFCEGCLSRMLRCAPRGQHFRQPAPSKASDRQKFSRKQYMIVQESPAVDNKRV